jgi:cob(I)alamin adenosyltransferase
MKLYTKQGDDGKTSLMKGKKVLKNHLRVEAYGTIDELNSVLGIITSKLKNYPNIREKNIKETCLTIQSLLFEIGTDLASEESMNTLLETDVVDLEKLIDQATEITPPLQSFILPGGHEIASYLHLARTVTRRAERAIVSLNEKENVDPFIMMYINRLSDLFFVWSRLINFNNNIEDVKWSKRNK